MQATSAKRAALRGLFLAVSFLMTGMGFAQTLMDTPISGTFENQTLPEVFEKIEGDYQLPFYYRRSWFSGEKRSFTFDRTPLSEALPELLSGTGLVFTLYANHGIVIAKKQALEQEYGNDFFTQQYESQLRTASQKAPEAELVVVGDSLNMDADGKVLFRGILEDKISKEPLIGAAIFFTELATGTSTGVDGTFAIEVPVGEYLMSVQAIGYREEYRRMRLLADGFVELALDTKSFDLREVVVEATADDANVRSAQIGLEKLSIAEIQEVPSFMGETDVIQSLLTLPGVTSVGEGAGGFNVRGGNIDQNLVMQDGAVVFNSSHVLGFFSIFNGDVVDNVALYKGHIPAQYGGRISSVLDVQTKNGDFKRWRAQGGIGIVASRLTFEGPIVKGKTSVMVSGRASYSDWALRLVENPDVKNSSARFNDLTAKLSQKIGDKGTVSITGYRSYDFFRFSNEFGYSWTTALLSLNWKQIITPNLSSSFEAVRGDYSSEFFQPGGADAFRLETGNQYTKLKQDFFFLPEEKHHVNIGAEYIFFDSKPERLSPYESGSAVLPAEVAKEQGKEFGFYVNDEFELNEVVSFSLGLRYSFFQNVGPYQVFGYEEGKPRTEASINSSRFFADNDLIKSYGGLEPRASLKVGVSAVSSVKLSYNRLRQYKHLVSNTAATTPVDIWQLSNRFIQPMTADNYSLGYFQNFVGNAWETSVEAFYKDIDKVVEYKDFAGLFLNEHLETELLNGQGRAYGVELGIHKNMGKWTGSFSYTWSRSERKVIGDSPEETINQGGWYPANFDKPHQLSVLAKYKPNKWRTLSLNFTYSTGRPITVPVNTYLVGTVIVPNYSGRNQFRIPDFHRLDFSYTVKAGLLKRKNFKGDITFSIYNVYFRKNAFSVFFKRQPGFFFPDAFQLATLGSAFPAITYNFKF